MRHELQSNGQGIDSTESKSKIKLPETGDVVLEKAIFNNIFEKDIRRVFIYKKAERLAKAIQLITPAFAEADALRVKLGAIGIALVDAALEPPAVLRSVLARELLTLSSMLTIARTSGLLSAMNTELMIREVHFLLQEVASYEEPRLALEEVPTRAAIAHSSKALPKASAKGSATEKPKAPRAATAPADAGKGHVKDREEAVLSVIRNKGQVSIKDISHLIRGVSEKTIQRELASLVERGVVVKQGERRWSTYSLAS